MIKKYHKYLLICGGLATVIVPPLLLTNVVKTNQANNNKQGDDFDLTNKWKLGTTNQAFNTLEDLDHYVQEHYTKEVPAQIYLDQALTSQFNSEYNQDFFSAIPLNNVVPLNLDPTTDEVLNYDQGMAYVYKGYNNQLYFTRDLSAQGLEKAKNEAQKSWMQLHQTYIFDDIYFASIYDLETYLYLIYQDPNANNKSSTYHLVLDSLLGEKDFKESYLINPVQTANGAQILPDLQANADQTSIEDLKALIEANILNNSQLMIQVNDQETNEPNIIAFDNLINASEAAALTSHLNYWNIGAQDGNSFYIVDNKKDSRGNLFGDYFLSSPTDLGHSYGNNVVQTGIMDKDNSWTRVDETYAQSKIKQNYDINAQMIGSLMSMALNRFKTASLTDDLVNDLGTKAEISIEDLLMHAQNYGVYHSQYKHNYNFFDAYDINLGTEDFFSYLNNVSHNKAYLNLGDELKQVSANLVSGKRYNAFYLLPVLRNYLISRLLVDQVSQQVLETVNQVFIALADMVSNEVNQLLKPLFIDITNDNLHNGIDLGQIYGFANHHNSIYNNPRSALDAAFDNGGIQGQITKAQIFMFSALTSIINQQIADLLYLTTNKKQVEDLVQISQQDINQLTNKVKSLIVNSNYSNKLCTKIEGFARNINEQYQALNLEIANYQANFSTYSFYWISIETNYDQIFDNESKKAWLSGALIMSKSAQEIADLAINTPFYEPKNASNEEETIDVIGFILTQGSDLIDAVSGKLDVLKSIDESKIVEQGLSALGKFLDATKTLEKLTSTIQTFFKFVPWVSNLLTAFSVIIELVNFFAKSYNDVYYLYRSPNQQEIIWNGGEEVTQFWQTNPTYDLDDLALNNPLRITVGHNNINTNSGGDASNFYFDGSFYDSPAFAFYNTWQKLLKAANNQLNDPAAIAEFQALVDVSFKDAIVFYYYPFAIPGSSEGKYWSLAKNYDGPNLEEMANLLLFGPSNSTGISGVKPILISNDDPENRNWYLNLENSVYLQSIWETSIGDTSNHDFAVEVYIKEVIKNLQPSYVLKVPETVNGKLVIEDDFSLPYPYFDANTKQVISGTAKDNLQLHQRVYNPNVISAYEDHLIGGQEVNIMEFLAQNWGYQMFDVPFKKVSLSAILKATSFEDIQENMITQNVYQAINLDGQIRYYWNLSGALHWLKSKENLDAQLTINSIINSQKMQDSSLSWSWKEEQYV